MNVRVRQRFILTGLLAPITLFLGVFFVGPLVIMAVFSVLEPGLYGGVEWNFYHWNYGRILGWADGLIEEYDPVYLVIFLRSLRLALVTVMLCLVVCFPVAFWVSRLSPRWKTFFLFLITLPFFASLIVRLYAWVMILKPAGALNQGLMWLGLIDTPLEIIFTERAVVTGMVYIMIPFMFLPLYASIEKLDFRLIEAAYDLYATPWRALTRVVLPLVRPGLVAGSILVFIPALGAYVVPRILGGGKRMMISNLIDLQFGQGRNWPLGASLSLLLMLIVTAALLLYVRQTGREAPGHG